MTAVPNKVNALKDIKIDKSVDGLSYGELAICRTELIKSFFQGSIR
jgi:hypothetical protein